MTWEQALAQWLSLQRKPLLLEKQRLAFEDTIVEVAGEQLSLTDTSISDGWNNIEVAIGKGEIHAAHLVARLMEEADKLCGDLANHGKIVTRSGIRKLLRKAVLPHRVLNEEHDLFPRLWKRVGNEVATRAREAKSRGRSEWFVLELLALAGYLYHLDVARFDVGAARQKAMRESSVLGLRGHGLLGAQNVEASGATDWVQPLPSLPPHRTIRPYSGFIYAVGEALGRFDRKESLLLSNLDPFAPAPQEYASMMPAVRGEIYKQYDSLILLFLCYCAIEQAVRARLDWLGVNHKRAGGAPIPIHALRKHLKLNSAEEGSLLALFDPGRGNVRNRLFHSSFALIPHCRPIIVDTALRGAKLTRNELFPEAYLEHARRILGSVTSSWGSDLDFSASDGGSANMARDAFAHLPSELAEGTFLEHFEQQSLIVAFIAPTMATLIKSAFLEVSSPKIEQVGAQLLVLEGVWRNTLTLLNFETVLLDTSGTSLTAHCRMLDENGLASQRAIGVLTQHMNAGRAQARAFLGEVIATRNALVHGNVGSSMSDLVSPGHIQAVQKALFLLASAAMHHLIRERAYFKHISRHASPEEQWLSAEHEMFTILRAHRAA